LPTVAIDETTRRRERARSTRPEWSSVCFHSRFASSSWTQIAFGIVSGSPAQVFVTPSR
jgi:hypothetical protein